MTPVLVGVVVVIVLATAIGLVAGGVRRVRHGRSVSERREGYESERRAASVPTPDSAGPDWIYGDSRPEQPATPHPQPEADVVPGEESRSVPASAPEQLVPTPVPAPMATPIPVSEPVRAQEPVADHASDDARAEAAAILQRAEEQAREILAAAETRRMRLEQEAARDRALAAEERTKLSAFLGNVLKEVQESGMGATIRDLRDLRERKEKASGD